MEKLIEKYLKIIKNEFDVKKEIIGLTVISALSVANGIKFISFLKKVPFSKVNLRLEW